VISNVGNLTDVDGITPEGNKFSHKPLIIRTSIIGRQPQFA
jgi:hypothetical protein